MRSVPFFRMSRQTSTPEKRRAIVKCPAIIPIVVLCDSSVFDACVITFWMVSLKVCSIVDTESRKSITGLLKMTTTVGEKFHEICVT